MIYAAAVKQLAALRDAQSAARVEVESRMTTFERAEQQLDTAQQQEAQLTEMLRAAQRRTSQLRGEFSTAEAQLREAAEHLAETQSVCHSLESQIATHVKCQRSVLLLTRPYSSHRLPPSAISNHHDAASSLSSPPQLCWMDPYSVLHAASGNVFTFDLVTTVRRGGEYAHAGSAEATSEGEDDTAQGSEGSDSGGEEGRGGSSHATLTSLLKDVVHDTLQGYHYTLLNTSTNDTAPCFAALGGGEETERKPRDGSAECPGHLPLSPSSAGELTRCLLQQLQSEAVRCGTQSLGVSLAVGRVVESTATIPAHIEDVLLPLLSHHDTTAVTAVTSTQRGRQRSAAVEGVNTVRIDAVLRDGSEGDGWGAAAAAAVAGGAPRSGTHDDRSASHSSSRTRFEYASVAAVPPDTTPTTSNHASLSPAPSATTLTGVQVCSMEEVDYWLEQVGLWLSSSDSHTQDTHDEAPGSSIEARSGSPLCGSVLVDAQPTEPLVILLGVNSQDAAGKVHSSLLRVVHDAAFGVVSMSNVSSRSDAAAGATPGKRMSAVVDGVKGALLPPSPPAASLFYLFMLCATTAVLRAVCHAHGLAGTVEGAMELLLSQLQTWPEKDEECTKSFDLEHLVAQLIEAPLCGPSTVELRTAVQSISSDPRGAACQLVPGASAVLLDIAASQQRREAWALWAALLKPVFGGNSKALWLHAACTTAAAQEMPACVSSREGSRRRGSPPSCQQGKAVDDPAAAASMESTLMLCTLFCRLVRHAAVACEVSADLQRLLSCERK
jgi:hypothetical protein